MNRLLFSIQSPAITTAPTAAAAAAPPPPPSVAPVDSRKLRDDNGENNQQDATDEKNSSMSVTTANITTTEEQHPKRTIDSTQNDVRTPPPPPTTTTTATTTSAKPTTAATASNTTRGSGSGVHSGATTPSFGGTTTNPSQQDSHPFARGSVIEVWQHSQKKDDWWSGTDSSSCSSSSEEEEDEVMGNDKHDDNDTDERVENCSPMQQDDDAEEDCEPKQQRQRRNRPSKRRTALLCDIIDRSNMNGVWRYYVHYRDFNRRMDEWIGIDRIMSPPSVGNAKARALKKLKQKLAQQQQFQQQDQQSRPPSSAGVTMVGVVASTATAAVSSSAATSNTPVPHEAADVSATFRSRRRSLQERESSGYEAFHHSSHSLPESHSAPTKSGGSVPETSFTIMSNTNISAAATTTTSGVGRKRRQSTRRKLDVSDDVTVVASNVGVDEEGQEGGTMAVPALSTSTSTKTGTTVVPASALTASSSSTQQSLKNKSKQIVIPDAVTTHTVGEHVVATLHAQELDEHEGLDEASLREHEEVTKVKNVNFLELGEFQMETWYFSPLPKELFGAGGFLEVLYVCEFSFNMFSRKSELRRFQNRMDPQDRHPPGNEIYRCNHLSMFEVDGLEEKIYCQNLCYLAKLFLDHKTLYFDVDPFLFYVLCEVDDRGFHPVGYFSKEKYSDVGYNLACILTFPAHQRKGYGRFLISFSYELTKKEEKVGSPEKPMSDLGQQAYKPYWASTIVDFLLHQSTESRLSIMDISKKTSIMAEDIVFTLNQLGILKIINGVYFIAAEQTLLESLADRYPVKEPRVDPTKLYWTPFLTDVKRDKFSIHSKKPSIEADGSIAVS